MIQVHVIAMHYLLKTLVYLDHSIKQGTVLQSYI